MMKFNKGVEMKTSSRRIFLKKSLVAASLATAGAALAKSEEQSSGVVSGKSKKKEVLYHKSKTWEKFYKTVY